MDSRAFLIEPDAGIAKTTVSIKHLQVFILNTYTTRDVNRPG